MKLNSDQQAALAALTDTDDNIFLTGQAGTGKSFVLRTWLVDAKTSNIPILASTGAAAILIGGRTFHGFFGLGIKGEKANVQELLEDDRLCTRMKFTRTIVIDEISMISGPVLAKAEEIARAARRDSRPWGGMRVIVVGDFSQLPPVNPHTRVREWAFKHAVWQESAFRPVVLREVMRTADPELLSVLNKIRVGICDAEVTAFLNARTGAKSDNNLLRLFSHRENTDKYNAERLAELPHELHTFRTAYRGQEWAINQYGKNLPIPNTLHLKRDALVMLRVNNPSAGYANGSLGHVVNIDEGYRSNRDNFDSAPGQIKIKLLSSGESISVRKHAFECLDKNGEVAVTAINFPITLAWASTIHKAQGLTVDRMLTDIRKVWEPGQAYVALSRARSADGIFLEGWKQESIFADKEVMKFYAELQ